MGVLQLVDKFIKFLWDVINLPFTIDGLQMSLWQVFLFVFAVGWTLNLIFGYKKGENK